MSNLKKAIILLIIFIIIITIALIVLLIKLQSPEMKQEDTTLLIDSTNISSVQDYELFTNVEKCIEKYINAIVDEDEKMINGLLEKNDKQANKNIDYENYKTFSAKKMFHREDNYTINTFYVYGFINNEKTIRQTYNKDTYNKEELYIIVRLDMLNKTYTIIPNGEEWFSIQDGSIIIKQEISEIENIEKNDYNAYVEYEKTEQDKVIAYFLDYLNNQLYNEELAFASLDEEYRENRFHGDIQNYITYCNSDIVAKQKNLASYNVNNKEEQYVIYTCKDQYDNIYIFKENGIMNYTVELDNYTLENKIFNEKYEKVSNRDKGILNVDKFFKMMNMADYKAGYALLDETFKLNNFKTEAEFERYMQSNIFRYNKVSYQTYSDKITDLLTFKLKLTDATGEDKREIQFNVVMKLGEGTDFTMSFEIVKE